jgi:cation diffusion facilitator CzcD-associated flavoprotein CzcO
MKVAIVGAGFSGIAMAIALGREGLDDFELYERADDLGGVWHHNTYPGATCDVPSYLYSYSFAQRRNWSKPCSPQQEILDYLHETAERYGVPARVRLSCEIVSAEFDAERARWLL